MVRLIFLVAVVSLSACATTGPVTDPREIWCSQNDPIRLPAPVIDELPRDDVDQINAHNDRGARWCGWTP